MADNSPDIKVTVKGKDVSFEAVIDQDAARRVIAAAMGAPAASDLGPAQDAARSQRARGDGTDAGGGARRSPRRRKPAAPGLVKDLVLRPQGKQSFKDFAAEKQPTTQLQRNIVAIYWLKQFGGFTEKVSADHVNTCYVDVGWPRPSDMANSLQQAGTKGWLDTSNMSDIKLTPRGEDEVNHNLPANGKK